jgi:hypothetical protein
MPTKRVLGGNTSLSSRATSARLSEAAWPVGSGLLRQPLQAWANPMAANVNNAVRRPREEPEPLRHRRFAKNRFCNFLRKKTASPTGLEPLGAPVRFVLVA